MFPRYTATAFRARRHRGLSTGPRTFEGKKHISDAQKLRWAAYRKKKAAELWAVEWLAERTGRELEVVAQHTIGRDVGRTRVG